MSVQGERSARLSYRHNQVGEKAEEQEGKMCGSSPAHKHDLEDGMDSRTFPLDLNGENSKENDLNGGSRGIPMSL